MNILVLCTGNSARSILLESIFTQESGGRLTGFSAGSKPAGKVHPGSIALLSEIGYPTEALSSKSWDVFAEETAPHMDIVITVCDSAANETCPFWPGAPVQAHWGVEDPAAAPESEWPIAFRTAYEKLKARADAFMALPFETMEPAALKAALTKIGQQ